MRILAAVLLGCLLADSASSPGSAAGAAGFQKWVMVLLWDVPRTSQSRGTATLQAVAGRSAPGFTVRVSLKVAGPGPDLALIGMGTCTSYKKLYNLNPVVNGLSNTRLGPASLAQLLNSHAVVILPNLRYCGVIP